VVDRAASQPPEAFASPSVRECPLEDERPSSFTVCYGLLMSGRCSGSHFLYGGRSHVGRTSPEPIDQPSVTVRTRTLSVGSEGSSPTEVHLSTAPHPATATTALAARPVRIRTHTPTIGDLRRAVNRGAPARVFANDP
jgi:hypothetical protein